MTLDKGKATLARIYCSENDRYHGEPLYEAILLEARNRNLAGCTVIPCVEGFGASTMIHSARTLRVEEDLPMVVEVVDSRERLQRFLRRVEAMLAEVSRGSLITLEDVEVFKYQPAVA